MAILTNMLGLIGQESIYLKKSILKKKGWCTVNKNRKISLLILVLVISVLVVLFMLMIARNVNTTILLSPLDAVSDLKSKDISAIARVIYDIDNIDDYIFVKNLKPRFIIGNKEACRKYLNVDAPIVDGIFIEKIIQSLPKPSPGAENMIASADDAGLAFVTKDGRLIVLELISGREQTYIAKYPCNALGKILEEIEKEL